MSSQQEISKEKIKSFIIEYLRTKTKDAGQAGALSDQTNLVESGLLTSFGFVELIGELESEFGFDIDLDDYEPEEFSTLGGIVSCAYQSKE